MWKDYLKQLKIKLFHPKTILMITNRGSDNCGDQVLEASDIALVRTVMKNLHISRFRYTIVSRDAGLVPRRYVEQRDPKDVVTAEKTIASCDLVLFGGAPMFNHLYQIFYERTALMIELAQKYDKKVLFSAIGIEAYDDANPKCQRIKEAANLPCVRSITTRDDYDALQKIKQREDLVIDKVPDPAVFCDHVFRRFNRKGNASRKKKRIGVFVLRSRGFEDNRMPLSHESAVEFYRQLYLELEERGYDSCYMTSGHFADEATLEKLVSDMGIPRQKCVMTMLSPEQMFSEISACDGILSCRLHPSIVAYACGIPSVGIEWNKKVSGFYDSIGYADRVIRVQDLTAEHAVQMLEDAMQTGVAKDTEYMYRLYRNLFEGIRDVFSPGRTDLQPYTMEELAGRIASFKGTRDAEMKLKLDRKFKRIYVKYNDLQEKLGEKPDGKDQTD